MARKTAAQKRQLDDPADISVSVAQPTKKTKAPTKGKKGAKANCPEVTNAEANEAPPPTTSTPNDPPPSTNDPSPPVINPPAPTASTVSASSTVRVAPTKKPRPKVKGQASQLSAQPTDNPAGNPAPAAPSSPDPAVVPENTAKKGSARVKRPSEIAQKVQAQEAAEQQVKEHKAKKKAKKAEAAVIEETPDETRAFLERAKASQITPTAAVVTVASDPPPPNRRKAMEHLIRDHQSSPALSAVSGLSLNSSAFSSLAPSESISQRNVPLHDHTVKSSRQPRLHGSTLSVPPVSSRDVSPAAESVFDDDFLPVDDATIQQLDPQTLLEGVPPQFAPPITMPELPRGPLQTAKRKVPAEVIDLTSMTAADRAKARRKNEPQLKHLRDEDQTIVSTAINRLESLLVLYCAFPNDEVCWNLANMANLYACQKHGRNLALTEDSEYQKILYNRIPNMHSEFFKQEVSKQIPNIYGLQPAFSTDSLEMNRDHIRLLMKDALFTCPSITGLDSGAFYEHPFFELMLKTCYFQSSTSDALVHGDIWRAITLPCLALVATGVEKLLLEYRTGCHKKIEFKFKLFAPRYYSHLTTLGEIAAELSSDKKAELLEALYEAGNSGHGMSEPSSQFARLLAFVGGGNSDSEVEAARAGAIPPRPSGGHVAFQDDTDDVVDVDGEDAMEAQDDGEDGGDDDVQVQGHEGDEEEEEAEEEEEEEEEEDDDDDDDDEDEDNTPANAATGASRRSSNILPSSLTNPSAPGVQSGGEDDESESDSEGTSGAGPAVLDADQTMMTAAGDDEASSD